MLRSLASGAEPGPLISPTSRHRRLTVAFGPIALAGAAGLLLASGTNLRPPGQTITGNAQSDVDPLVALERTVSQSPEDSQARLHLARYLMGAEKPVEAIRQFDETLRLDPDNAEAHAYGGWITFLAGLPDEAMRRLDAAVVADPATPTPTSSVASCCCGRGTTRQGQLPSCAGTSNWFPTVPCAARSKTFLPAWRTEGSGRLLRTLVEPSGR